MSENPLSRKVHVKVIPTFETDPDSDGSYFVSLELNLLELQLRGEIFANAARRVIYRTLEEGDKIRVWRDDKDGGQSNKIDFSRMVERDDIVFTGMRRLATSEGKSLTDFSNTTRIGPLTPNDSNHVQIYKAN